MNKLEEIQNIDIYLLDQILKGRYLEGNSILDAGCGFGRNLQWFSKRKFDLYGIDSNEETIKEIKSIYPTVKLVSSKIDDLPFLNEKFEHIICSAVLHFATDESHFYKMFSELIRVLKRNGTLFIRMTTDVGVTDTIYNNINGVYDLKDGSKRFLITKEMLSFLLKEHSLELIEPFKTTVVEDLRSMATIVLRKI